MTSFWEIVTSLSFFRFMANLENLEAEFWMHSIKKIAFSLITNNLLSYKNNIELKNFKHSSHTIALSKGTILAKKMSIFCKKMLTSA